MGDATHIERRWKKTQASALDLLKIRAYGLYYYPSFTTTGNGQWTINEAMTLGFTINPAAGFSGWFTGNYYQVGGYVNAQSVGGTTGTVSVQGQVQSIEIQFS